VGVCGLEAEYHRLQLHVTKKREPSPQAAPPRAKRRATYVRRRSRASELWVLIKYQTNTTAMTPSAVVTPCGSISAHAVSHVPRQKNCPGTQLLHSTPVYLHTCAALCARRVRVRAPKCVCVCEWVAGQFTCVGARVRAFLTWGERYLSSHSKSGPPLQRPESHCQNRAG
jgi:hypothetical protein